MNILITGGAGFIGSHLSELLLGQGNSVVVVDDLSTGSLENIEMVRNRRLGDLESFADVRDTEFLSFEQFHDFQPGAVTHGEKHLTTFIVHRSSNA